MQQLEKKKDYDLQYNFTEFSVERTCKINIDLNEHYKNWNPQANLEKLKSHVHEIIKVNQ